MNDAKVIKNKKTTADTQKDTKELTYAQILKMTKMKIITSPDQIKLRKNEAEINRRNFHILRTELKGKLDGGGKSAMELLGRE